MVLRFDYLFCVFLVSRVGVYGGVSSEVRITNELGCIVVAACDNEMGWMDGWDGAMLLLCLLL